MRAATYVSTPSVYIRGVHTDRSSFKLYYIHFPTTAIINKSYNPVIFYTLYIMIEMSGFPSSFLIGSKSCQFYWTSSQSYFKHVLAWFFQTDIDWLDLIECIILWRIWCLRGPASLIQQHKQPSRYSTTVTEFIDNYNQLNMFRAIISTILRSTRLCIQLMVQCTGDDTCWWSGYYSLENIWDLKSEWNGRKLRSEKSCNFLLLLS